jgi:SAM-dependent methyltransferase
MRLYTTDTTDFDDAEIRAIRERDGQLYADVSTKAALDDFAVDLRKLVPLEECGSCPKRPECGGAFRGDSENVFEHDASHVDRILRGLRGSIVDVGCGEGPYLAALRENVREGHAEYCGVDPDGARIALLRGRNPWAAYREGTLEDEAPAGPVSHVLFLRSYNHLPDPARTIALAVSRLALGGTLLVVDNVAFGLLRRGAQAARAESGPAGFEHYRNASAADAAAVIERIEPACLTLRERRDVTPASSNEWLLHYEKTGTG